MKEFSMAWCAASLTAPAGVARVTVRANQGPSRNRMKLAETRALSVPYTADQVYQAVSELRRLHPLGRMFVDIVAEGADRSFVEVAEVGSGAGVAPPTTTAGAPTAYVVDSGTVAALFRVNVELTAGYQALAYRLIESNEVLTRDVAERDERIAKLREDLAAGPKVADEDGSPGGGGAKKLIEDTIGPLVRKAITGEGGSGVKLTPDSAKAWFRGLPKEQQAEIGAALFEEFESGGATT